MSQEEAEILVRLQLIQMENNLAQRETLHGGGWHYDHAAQVFALSREIDALIPSLPKAKEKME
jgi:hypothetical protein